MKKILLKHKKLLVRIGSILACLLLVGALVLPCFALSSSSTYREVVDQYVTDNNMSNPAYTFSMNAAQTLHGDNFDYWLSGLTNVRTGYADMVASTVDDYIYTGLVNFNDTSSGYITTGNLSFDFGYWYIYDGQNNYDYWSNVLAMFAVVGNQCEIQIVNSNFSPICVISGISSQVDVAAGIKQFKCTTVSVRFHASEDDIRFINPDGQNCAFFFADSGSFGYANGMYNVALNDDVTPSFSPKSLLSGWVYGSNEGGGASQEELDAAYQNGYQLGLTNGAYIGYDEGYLVGVNKGQTDNIGENFFGNTFSAIIDGLRSFTIIEFPNGYAYSLLDIVTAIVAISVFVLFLKMFAGG